MAPLPDNDKAPDKTDKSKEDKDSPKESQKDEKTLSNLNDRELKALLDEAINYKNPKDREGKSELFNDLLLEAEETERIARATSAGGSELVRHCNPAARRQRHGGGPRGRRYGGPTSSGLMGRSVSERGTHGGSLDNLAKEELYEATCRRLRGARKSSTSSSGASSSYGGNQVRVSARQREGGSLPCNVNSGDTSRDFLEEAKRTREMRDKDYTVVDMETERLLENDLLARGYEERLIDGGGPSRGGPSNQVDTSALGAVGGPKYTSKATLQIQANRASNVDDPLSLDLESASSDKKTIDANMLAKVVQHSKYQVIIPTYPTKATGVEEKKVDENGNALHQTKEKKKKKQSDKNVVVLKSENIEGHKSEIINNVDQLLHYIEGTTENNLKPRPVQASKSKQLHKQHASEDGGSKTNKKRHSKSGVKEAGGEVTGEGRHELKKSNSLSEISGMKLDREFEAFSSGKKNKQEKDEENVVLRGNKPSVDRARERRSWGNVEAPSFQTLYNASSLENLETSTDNWEVTRPKKKSKKRRNSVSSASGARQNSSASGVSSTISNEDRRSRRAPSPDLGVVIVGVSHVKTTRSMPHSEKSNDSSSDVDSVHSLPMDGPISYADIAKNSEKKKPSPEKQDRPAPPNKEKSPLSLKFPENDVKTPTGSHNASLVTSPLEKTPSSTSALNLNNSSAVKSVVPDVHNIKSFPAITGSVTKSSPPTINTTASYQTPNVTSTSDKAVQSTLTYEETFAREKTPPSTQKPSSVGVALQTIPIETIQGGAMAQSTPLAGSGPPLAAQGTPLGSDSTSLTPASGGKRQSSPNSSVGKTKGAKEGGKVGLVCREMGCFQVNPVQGFFGGQGDVHNELSFFAQIMKDSAQYAVQRMPPDIVDVATLEKMQFMNYSNPGNVTASTQSGTPLNSTQVSYTQTPPSGATGHPDGPTHPGGKGKRRKGGSGNNVSRNSEAREESGASSVCDTSSEERGDGGGSRMVNGISDETFSSPEPPSQQPPLSPPPVVILSGHAKEAPLGLIFGFDINEQLLLEDSGGGGDTSSSLVSGQNVSENIITENHIERLPCGGDEWATRFKPPANDKGPPKHNHDKIVSFISTAWETVINQKIQYYSDNL